MIKSRDIFTEQPDKTSFPVKTFEKLYIASRKREDRIYSDDQVLQLPFVEPTHVHYSEWKVRKRSAYRLIRYLEKMNRPLEILEVGCGNGWLSGNLSVLKNSTVTGTDINKTELSQARRVFAKRPNICFEEGDLNIINPDKKFDVILFAASIQYFPLFEAIVRQAFSLLNPSGEIHILDSPFYHDRELEPARQRSHLYYQSIGFGEMAEFYFHHSYNSFSGFSNRILYNPISWKNKVFRKKDPFPWICITNE